LQIGKNSLKESATPEEQLNENDIVFGWSEVMPRVEQALASFLGVDLPEKIDIEQFRIKKEEQ